MIIHSSFTIFPTFVSKVHQSVNLLFRTESCQKFKSVIPVDGLIVSVKIKTPGEYVCGEFLAYTLRANEKRCLKLGVLSSLR